MARDRKPDLPEYPPVLHTPAGALPRSLRSDAFEARTPLLPQRPAAEPERQSQPGERDWDFAMPEPPERKPEAVLIHPDANLRHHPALKLPAGPAPLPDQQRERFNDNWQRLAAEPVPPTQGALRRSLEQSKATRWMFSRGRFDIASFAGLLLLAALLCSAIYYGHRLLAAQPGSAGKAAPQHTAPAP